MEATEEIEEWRPVVGYEGRYEVSNLGRVKSIRRSRKNPSGNLIMSPSTHGDGYKQVQLADGRIRTFRVHVLVLTAFVGPKPDGTYGCHNDGNPANNCKDNLRWDTPSANQRDREKHGTGASGGNNPRAVLSPSDVVEIRKELLSKQAERGLAVRLARRYGVSSSVVYAIKNGRSWT